MRNDLSGKQENKTFQCLLSCKAISWDNSTFENIFTRAEKSSSGSTSSGYNREKKRHSGSNRKVVSSHPAVPSPIQLCLSQALLYSVERDSNHVRMAYELRIQLWHGSWHCTCLSKSWSKPLHGHILKSDHDCRLVPMPGKPPYT